MMFKSCHLFIHTFPVHAVDSAFEIYMRIRVVDAGRECKRLDVTIDKSRSLDLRLEYPSLKRRTQANSRVSRFGILVDVLFHDTSTSLPEIQSLIQHEIPKSELIPTQRSQTVAVTFPP